MILNRLGNKKKIAKKISKFFPAHSVYIEPFFGAGGMFFNKEKSKYNIVNDIDTDVYNLFRQLVDNKEKLIYYLTLFSITEKQFVEWVKGKREKTNILNAIRFLILSNFSLYGKNTCLKISAANQKKIILENIEKTFVYLKDVIFVNKNYIDFINSIEFPKRGDKKKFFCYCDPPYVGGTNNYNNKFDIEDLENLINILIEKNINFGISEFKNSIVLELIKKYNLNIIEVCNRRTIKNKNTEIYIYNYDLQLSLFNPILPLAVL